MGVLLCILGTVVRYKIISVDDQRFGQILFLGFLKKDVTITRFWRIIEIAGRKKKRLDEDDTEEGFEEKAAERKKK